MKSVDVAVWAASRGWAVAPGVPGTKKASEPWAPRNKMWGTEGYLTVDDVREKWPAGSHSVLILTGPSHLVCDDLDVDDEGNPAGAWSLEDIAGERELPRTFTMATPSGGMHLVWQSMNGRTFKTCAGQVGPHIDVRGDGGLFVLWDPKRPGRFVIDDRDPAPIPKWLAELHPERDASDSIVSTVLSERGMQDWIESHNRGRMCQDMMQHVDDAMNDYAGSLSGDRVPHDVLIRYSTKMIGDAEVGHRGIKYAIKELQDMHQRAMRGKSRQREWFEEFNNAIIGAIAKKSRPGRKVTGDPCKVGDIGSRIGKSVKQQKNSKLLATIKSGSYLNTQKFAPLQYAIPGLLPEGYVLLAGAPFTGKTVLMLRFALEIARGGHVFGIKVKRRHVYYLALETSEARLQDSCFEILGDGIDIPDWFNYETDIPPKQLIPKVDAYLDTYPRALVLIDTLGRVMEPPLMGETTYDRDYRIGSYLKDLDKRYTGCTVLASRHTKKGKSDDWLELVSGTNAVTGAADTTFILSRTRGMQDGMLQVSSRLMDEAEYSLTLERPYGWLLDGQDLDEAKDMVESRKREGKRDRLGKRSRLLIDFVEANSNGVTPQQVANELGITVKEANVYLSNNVNSGQISRIRRGLYGPSSKLRAGSNEEDDD